MGPIFALINLYCKVQKGAMYHLTVGKSEKRVLKIPQLVYLLCFMKKKNYEC